MNVYLYRHGACEEPEAGKADEERLLTGEGRQAVSETLRGLRALIPQVDYILTSPMKRAVETAALVAAEYKCAGFIEILPALAGRGNEAGITSVLNKLIGKEHILVVGHSPHLGELAKHLAGEKLESPPDIKKAGAAKIHIKGFPGPGEGMLRWVMTADELKKTGERSPHSMTE